MIKRISLLIAAVLLVVVLAAMTAAPAFADNAPPGCEKKRGTIVCEDEPSNNWQQSKKGSINSSHDTATTNPGGNQAPGHH